MLTWIRGAAIALLLAVLGAVVPAAAQTPAIAPVAGRPTLMLSAYDLGKLGYVVEEFFLTGTATSYRLPGPPSADGNWAALADRTAPYVTRVVVIRPGDAARFNGSVLVEWLNVTSGQDTPATWMVGHREILRRGYAYVAVSAQQVGIEGGNSVMAQGASLKKSDPLRYGALSHPGDAFSFDIFSQAGRAVKAGQMLGGLKPARYTAIGESQSAAYLTTYVNAVDPLARVYDGFFVHSRFGSGASLDGTPMRGAAAGYPDHIRFRRNLRVPVLSLITETDLLGARLAGYHASRRPDDRRLRVWEITGAAHADNYLFAGAFIDDGSKSAGELARVFRPMTSSAAGNVNAPFNTGQPHHYTVNAALAGLDSWLRSGRPPARTVPIRLASGGKPGVPPRLARDANGLALGGLRTPWVDVPIARLTGEGDPASFIGMLAGSTEMFDTARLERLYPGGKADYMAKFTRALDRAIRARHLVADDRQEILDVAAINFDWKP